MKRKRAVALLLASSLVMSSLPAVHAQTLSENDTEEEAGSSSNQLTTQSDKEKYAIRKLIADEGKEPEVQYSGFLSLYDDCD